MPIDPTQPYDDNNVFARILRGELPSKKVYEDDFAFAFHDINPLAPVHILVIPKGSYVSWDDFSERASDEEIAGFIRAVGRIARRDSSRRGIAFSPTSECAEAKKCRTSTRTSSGASLSGRCSRARGLPSRAEPLGSAANLSAI